jgi:hypothetical protein
MADGPGPEARDAGSDQGTAASFHLWVAETNGFHVYGYGAARLQALNGDPPDVDLGYPGVINHHQYYMRDVKLDPQGGLWTYLECGCGGDQIWKITAAQALASGTVTADAILGPPTSAPGGNINPTGPWMAFDAGGDLWWQATTLPNHSYVLSRLDAAALATLTATPAVVASTFSSTYSMPGSVVVDGAGNVYTFFEGTSNQVLARYDAGQVTGSGSISDTPAMTITVGPTRAPSDVVLTPSGQIIVAVGADIYRYSKQQVSQTGANLTTAPETHFTLTGVPTGFVPAFLALDPDGNLYMTTGAAAPVNQIVKVAAADLAQTGTVSIPAGVILRAPTTNTAAVFGPLVIR